MCIRDFVKKWLYKVTTGLFAATTVLFVVLYLTKVGVTATRLALKCKLLDLDSKFTWSN